jgi:predicted ester cyclase
VHRWQDQAGVYPACNAKGCVTMSDQNTAVVRRIVEEHWNNKNAALVPELFAATVSLETPDGVLTGLAGAGLLLQAYGTAFPDFRLSIDDLLADGDQVVLRWTFTGTHQGPLADIAASGKAVNVPRGIAIFHLAGAKVDQGYMAWDKYGLLQQVGALPTPTPATA